MALNARVFGRSLLCCHGLRPSFVSQFRLVSLQSKPAQVPIEEGHDERNMRLCRPQSPHITIYKWRLPATLSITHRFTGIALSGYAGALAFISILSNKPMGEIVENISQCYPNFFLICKLGLIFPFTYHFFNGVRHLVWDNGKVLSLKGVYASGYLMLLSAGVSGLVWDTGKALTLKAVYITGYTMLLCSIAAFGFLFYLSEEQKKIAREAELKRKAEEEAARAAEQEKNSKKKKKKK